MKKLVFVLSCCMLLQACVETAIVAGAVTAVSAVNDPRPVSKLIDDNTIEVKASYNMAQDEGLRKHTNINVVSYDGVVLAVGQSPNKFLIDKAIGIISGLKGVKKVHNQVKLGTPADLSAKAKDAWITTKVKSELLTDETLSGHKIKVITENKEVFLMGTVSKEEADRAAKLASEIYGVERVVKVF